MQISGTMDFSSGFLHDNHRSHIWDYSHSAHCHQPTQILSGGRWVEEETQRTSIVIKKRLLNMKRPGDYWLSRFLPTTPPCTLLRDRGGHEKDYLPHNSVAIYELWPQLHTTFWKSQFYILFIKDVCHTSKWVFPLCMSRRNQ